MSVGKSAISRVENNGYSRINSSAPDMENSHIVKTEKKSPLKAAKAETHRKAKAKSAVQRKTVQKSESAKKENAGAVVKTPTAVSEKAEETKACKGYLNIGDEMPVYLL